MEKPGEIYKYLLDNKSSLIELAKKFSSYNNAIIDPERMISFLLQLESLQKIKLFIQILQKVDYLDQSHITDLLELAYKKASINEKSVKFFPLGSVQDSSAVACYRFFKSIFDDEKDILNNCCEFSTIGEELEKGNVLEFVFVDDNITSGTQVKTFFEELFKQITLNKREMVKKPLSDLQISNLKKIKIKILYAIKLSNISDKIVEELKAEYNIQLEIFHGKEDLNNYLLDLQSVIKDGTIDDFKNWISEISVGLFEGKGYPQDKVENRLLGYGNLTKLTVFSHNTPKSLITPLWRSGKYRNLSWIPLFPEFNESKIIKKNGLEFHPLNKELSYLIINGKPIEPLPKLVTYIFPDTVRIPSREYIKGLMKDFRIFVKPEPNTIKPTGKDLQALLDGIYPSMYDEEKYKKYLSDVEKINVELTTYYDLVEDYLLILGSASELTFQIYNLGDEDAKSVTWKTKFNSGEFILSSFNQIEITKPSFSNSIPRISDYNNVARVVNLKPDWNKLSATFYESSEKFELNEVYDLNIFNEIGIIVKGNEKNQTFILFITDSTLDKVKIPYNLLYINRLNDEFGSNEVIIERVNVIDSERQRDLSKELKTFFIPGIHDIKTKYLNL